MWEYRGTEGGWSCFKYVPSSNMKFQVIPFDLIKNKMNVQRTPPPPPPLPALFNCSFIPIAPFDVNLKVMCNNK